MGDLLRGENDSKWLSEVQAIGDRIFFTDIQWCKNFSSIIAYKRYFFFRAGSFFPGYFLARFFSLEISLESRPRPESAKVLLVEFGKQQIKVKSLALKGGILGFGTRNTAQGIWNSPTIGIQNQSSIIKESEMRYMESVNYGVESAETKTVALN